MGCHKFVAGTDESQKSEIFKFKWFMENSGIPFYKKPGTTEDLKDKDGFYTDLQGNKIPGVDGKPFTALTGATVAIP